ncbi:PAS domain-containing sensor histidine kinase [Mucilaginibacter aquaedulcis]|uniref:PAS domain-containing sensor histidine kinase n=1 Tax=Mucilaginibacter aquaedulcis TaxID=1187081 RepID=UPI0025B49A82|nr:PAS domain-containing sensor histidine kinase [Mucilaginibacter aquaedulcis]MDN3551242.1 PAS domain-containing sensor histidine kinase [Mucilaginibacter aquaedulcis]
MVQLLGYDQKEDLVGTRILDFAPIDHHKDWSYLQEKLWKELTPSFSLETQLIKKDGTIIWCQITSILFPDNGQTLGYTIIEDVTEKYNLRQQKEEFISVASHELKTPLTSLKATLQLISRIVSNDIQFPDNLKKLLVRAERSATKLSLLVVDLLNTTKIEQGELALNKSRFIVSELVESCCSHIQMEGKYNIKFHGEQYLEVFGDHQKIDQVLVNFVTNAVKYAPNSMEIIIRAEKRLHDVKISVTDKGQGLLADDLNKVFDRYYRAKFNKNQTSGLGLGLYISAQIISRHGGEIGVNSTLGEGATFWFTLPDQEQ